jgi:hypothetical protein
MFGTTGDLMNTIMASGIAQERAAAAQERAAAARALEPRRPPARGRVTVRSAVAAGWHRVRTLVATVLA